MLSHNEMFKGVGRARDKSADLPVRQMLKHLPNKADISAGQFILGEVEHPEIDSQIAVMRLIEFDQVGDDVTRNIAIAQPPDAAPHGEVAATQIDRIRLGIE